MIDPYLQPVVRRLDHLEQLVQQVLTQLKAAPPPEDDVWLSLDQASRIANLSTSTLRRAIRRGKLRASDLSTSPGRPSWRVRRQDLDAYLTAGQSRPTATPKVRSRHYKD